MNQRSVALVIIFILTTFQEEQQGVYLKIEENSFVKHDEYNVIGNVRAQSLTSCSLICTRQELCKSANFIAEEGACLLYKDVKDWRDVMVTLQGSFYIEKIISEKTPTLRVTSPGSSQLSAVPSCQSLRSQSPPFISGVYWINPDGGSQDNAFKAYCDMETDGGGWTLVWSYTFTNYTHFSDKSNAVTPTPSWQTDNEVDVNISSTPPLCETDYNAVNFSLWKHVGRQVLIKSNINNWLVCHPGNGSLVEWQDGSVTCLVIKNVTYTCNGPKTPSKFARTGFYGPMFHGTGHYYYFDGSRRENFPTHNPCGESGDAQLKNVTDPHGNIYIR